MTKKMKLSFWVLAFIAVLLAFFLLSTLVVGSVLKDSGQRYDSFYENVYEYQMTLTNIGQRQTLAMGHLVKSVYEQNAGELRVALEQLTEQNDTILVEIEALSKLLTDSPHVTIQAQKPLLDDYLTTFRAWDTAFSELTSYISSGDKEKAKQMLADITPQWMAFEAAFVSLQNSFGAMASSEKLAAAESLSKSLLSIRLVALVLVVMVAVLGFFIAKDSVRLERDAFRAKKRLDLIAAGTKDCCSVLNLKNEKMEYYTYGAEGLFGAHLQSISTLNGFAESIAKADKEKFSEAVRRSASGAPARVLYRYKRTEIGSVCYISTDMYPIFSDSTKKQESVLLVSSDVTEKHLLEEHSQTLSALFENGNYMISVFKNQTQMEYVNQAALLFRGLSTPEQALAMSFSSFFDSPDLYAKEIPDEIKKPEPMSIMRRVPLRRYDGQIVSVEQTLFAFKDGNGSNKYAVIGQDISDKIIYEEALEAAKTDVSAVKTAKTNVFAAMGQRITTPMALMGEKLQEALACEELPLAKGEIAEAERQLISLSELICNVIDIAKVQTGVLRAEKQDFVLTDVVKKLEQRYRQRFEDKGLDFDVRMKNVSGHFLGDEKRIAQVVQNLLSNALAYTEKGNVSLSVDILSKTQDFVIVGFTVADSGCGIPDSKLASLWSEKSIDTTTNLGLAASKQIAFALGGDVTVTSVMDSGSVFYFTARLVPTNTQTRNEKI